MDKIDLLDTRWGFPSNVRRIQYGYQAREVDKLSISPGQLVRVLHHFGDGCSFCSLLDRYKKGVAPRKCFSVRCVNPRPPNPREYPLSPGWYRSESAACDQRNVNRLSFLDLPREVRDMVYSQYFDQDASCRLEAYQLICDHLPREVRDMAYSQYFDQDASCRLEAYQLICDLPRELRDMVYSQYFDQDASRRLEAYQLIWERWEDETNGLMVSYERWLFEASLVYTCEQVRRETEPVLYKPPTFVFSPHSWSKPSSVTLAPHKFLQDLPGQSRKWVQRLHMPCFDQFCDHPFTEGQCPNYLLRLHGWTVAMVFLSQECNITNLTLLAPGTLGHHYRQDNPEFCFSVEKSRAKKEMDQWMMRNAGMEKSWVKPLMLLGSVRKLNICLGPQMNGFRRDLQAALEASRKHSVAVNVNGPSEFVKFLELPIGIRNRIYRLTIIPSDNNIHPYIRSWYDSDTRNIIPLFLTCHQVHQEAEDIFYRSATFASSVGRYNDRFLAFLQNRSPEIRAKISHIRIFAQPKLSHTLMQFLADEMPHVRITYQIPECWVEGTIRQWRRNTQNWADRWIPLFRRFEQFRMERSASEGPWLQGAYSGLYVSRKWEELFPLEIHYDVPQSLRF